MNHTANIVESGFFFYPNFAMSNSKRQAAETPATAASPCLAELLNAYNYGISQIERLRTFCPGLDFGNWNIRRIARL